VLDRSLIGYRFEPATVDVERGQLKFFAKATGETRPVYCDEVAAIAAEHRALPAPPTFLFTLGLMGPDSFPIIRLFGLSIGAVLHAGQRFSQAAQIYAGDTLRLSAGIRDIYEKKAGLLEFIVQESSAINQYGQPVGESISTFVVRNG
jgi:hypothetical protein